MGDITILIIFVLSICYLAYKVLNDQRNEDEAERQALLASIKELKKRGRTKKVSYQKNPQASPYKDLNAHLAYGGTDEQIKICESP